MLGKTIQQLKESISKAAEEALDTKLSYESYLVAYGRQLGRKEALEILTGLLDNQDIDPEDRSEHDKQ